MSFYLISIYLSGERTSFFLFIILLFSVFIIIKILRPIILYSTLILILFAFACSYFKVGTTDPASRMFVKTFNQITDHKSNSKNKNDSINQNISENTRYIQLTMRVI